MRIGIDCRSLLESEPSGVSVYTRETLRALVRLPESAQHQFVCFVNGFRFSQGKMRMHELHAVADGSHVVWRVRTWPHKLLTTTEVLCCAPNFRWMFGNVDVAFIPNLQFFPYRDRSIPYVLTIHDLSFERYPDCLDLKGRLRHRLLRPRASARTARRVIAVSEYTKWDVEMLYGLPSDRVNVVYPGSAAAVTSTRPELPLRPSGSHMPQQYVAFVSTLEPRKNMETLLQAMEIVRKKHPDLELVVIGRRGWKSAKLLERLRALPYVHYLGYTSEEVKGQVLAGARAFIYPSLYEGFGFPPLEAQQQGIPVIAGAHSSLPEVVGESALLVDVLDAEAITRAIQHVHTDQALRQQLIAAGHENVHRFTWEQSARQVLNVLTGV